MCVHPVLLASILAIECFKSWKLAVTAQPFRKIGKAFDISSNTKPRSTRSSLRLAAKQLGNREKLDDVPTCLGSCETRRSWSAAGPSRCLGSSKPVDPAAVRVHDALIRVAVSPKEVAKGLVRSLGLRNRATVIVGRNAGNKMGQLAKLGTRSMSSELVPLTVRI